ncbi:hypothetical protein AK812_SmicGene23122 [Symbiodinium microadriaticum]|uniref:Protein kinase domain-containing protein n=1 Tax=Symbiodinium microadriaticum TaxID=2951 RepID=A0A1Q9DI20_SYMMI|nr:hypothetical protein AK812_SmicGene23122 [Symbiodinium microadriaticum]
MLAFTVLADLLGKADQVTTDRASRPRMVPLLQLCVCTLWRSKIGDKLASDEGDSVLLGKKFVEGGCAETEHVRRSLKSWANDTKADAHDLFSGIQVPVRLAGGSAPSAATLLQLPVLVKFWVEGGRGTGKLKPRRRSSVVKRAWVLVLVDKQVEDRLRTAVAFARALVEQLAPTMASISSVAYHRDVNAHNILVDVDAAGRPTHSLVDFGLAVNASTWMDPSPKNPGGKSEWEFLDVGGDCRYWPVSAWRQFEAGCRALSEAPQWRALRSFAVHGLGLTVLQVLVAMLPREGLVLRELRTLQDAWTQYWDDATEFWSALLNTFRHGGNWSMLKQEFVARGVHRIIAQRLKKLHDALNTALSAAAAANLDDEGSLPFPSCKEDDSPGGTSDWPHGSAGLLWALLAMVSYGEERAEPAQWGEVIMRLGRSEPRQHGDVRAPAAARSDMKAAPPERLANLTKAPRLLEYLSKLRDLTGKVNELSQDFKKLTTFQANVAEN